MRHIKILLIIFLLSTSVVQASTVNYSAARNIIAPQLSTTLIANSSVEDFTIASTTINYQLSGDTSGTANSRDISYNTFTNAVTRAVCNVSTNLGFSQSATYTAVTPSISTISQTGSSTYVSDGTAKFNVTSGRRTRGLFCPFVTLGGQINQTLRGYASSSLAYNIMAGVRDKVISLTPSATTYNLYSATDDTSKIYTRNTSIWSGNVDLTSIPTYGLFGTSYNGVLVGQDIVIQANHAHVDTGNPIYFTDGNNVTYLRTIATTSKLMNTDIQVARLSSDLPASIHPAKTFPFPIFGTTSPATSYVTYDAQNLRNIPLVYTNQFRTFRIGTLLMQPAVSGGGLWGEQPIFNNNSSDPFYAWYSPIIVGDSGSSSFLIINGEAIVLGVWSSETIPTDIANYQTYINTVISLMGSSHTIQTADLSSFSTY